MTYILDIPLARPPLTSNEERGAHWSTVRKARNTVGWHVKAKLRGIPRLDRCHVKVVWHVTDKRTRDVGSLAPFAKAAIDTLVASGVLVADDGVHVLSERYEIEQGCDRAHITITLEPVEAVAEIEP